jgi:hypothetical protein
LYYLQAHPDVFSVGGYPPRTAAAETKTLGYTFDLAGLGDAGDTVYRLGFKFQHSASSLVLAFSASGLQDLLDESWGLDNVEVRVSNSP